MPVYLTSWKCKWSAHSKFRTALATIILSLRTCLQLDVTSILLHLFTEICGEQQILLMDNPYNFTWSKPYDCVWIITTEPNRMIRIVLKSYTSSSRSYSPYGLTLGNGDEVMAESTVILVTKYQRAPRIVWTESHQIWIAGKLYPYYVSLIFLVESYYLGKQDPIIVYHVFRDPWQRQRGGERRCNISCRPPSLHPTPTRT